MRWRRRDLPQVIRRALGKINPHAKATILSVSPKRLIQWYEHLSTDIFVISFPKCGRTWLHLMLGKALQLHLGLPDGDFDSHRPMRLVNRAKDLPRIVFSHDDNPQLKAPEEIEHTKKRYGRNRVIFLARDPRDVVISMFFENSKRRTRYFGDLRSFLGEPKGSIDSIITFYNVWDRSRVNVADFLLVRYEDLQTDPQGQLARVLDFVGYSSVPRQTVADAVAFASFDNMRRMESEEPSATGFLRPGSPGDPESFKTRRGKVGGFSDYLAPEEIASLNKKLRANLSASFGYTF